MTVSPKGTISCLFTLLILIQVVNYDPENLDILTGVGGGHGTVGLGQDTGSSESPRVRAATECVAIFHLLAALRTTLSHHGLLRLYVSQSL